VHTSLNWQLSFTFAPDLWMVVAIYLVSTFY